MGSSSMASASTDPLPDDGVDDPPVVEDKHDANHGVNWDMIEDWAAHLYPEKEQS